MKRSDKQREIVMIKSFIVNATLIAIKFIAGLIFTSAALIADAIHSLSDFMSDILVIVGLRHSHKPPDKEHPFGHGKIEYVLSLLLGIGIIFIAYQLLRNLMLSFGEAPQIPSVYGLVVAFVVIVVKLLLARYMMKKAHSLDSQVIKASAQESFTDVMGSVVVIIGISLGVIGGHFDIDYLIYGDSLAAFIIALFIIRVAFIIIKDAIRSILGQSASSKILSETKRVVQSVKGVYNVDKLTMIVYGHYYQVMVDIRVDGSQSVKAGHDIASTVKKKLKENPKIGHVIVHVNPEVE